VYTCPLVPRMAGGSAKICLPRSFGKWYWGVLINLVPIQSIRDCKSYRMKNISFLIGDFNSPVAFIRFSKLNSAISCPAGGLKRQLFFCARFIVVKPFVVDKRFFRHRVE